MSSKIQVLAEIKDLSLKEKLASLMAGDWTASWILADAERNPQAASIASVGVIDDPAALALFGKSSAVIFCGATASPEKYFNVVDGPPETLAEELFKAVKLAFAYRETTKQNIESLYPNAARDASLESIANSLSEKMRELKKLSDMRLALVEQLPVGVLGVDDEGIVALANAKALELLGMEDIPVWGMDIDELLKGQATEFLKDKDREETQITVYGQSVVLRKSPFILEKRAAGTILILLRPWVSNKAG